ncbi:MAG: argininosuccinate synthase [Clostridiales Family XIII bacterium]|jgi:argininosuccinate synthase|nr:argininosuccinate synthase [Clostridiales Family XIII bacterium]
MAREKIVLAYSGGLDTSVILTWLKERYDADIVTVCCDAGQGDDMSGIDRKAYATGAIKSYTLDIKDEFVESYVWPTLKAGAVYENGYLLGTSIARPLMAKKLVEIAHDEGASAIAHGCTGKGNDQVRFESAFHALDPSIRVIAPWRVWDFKSREDLIDYAASKGIPIEQTKAKIYSRDQNLWHISHEGGNLEDTWNEHADDIYVMSVPVEQAPDEPTYVEIGFEAGVPVTVDGEKLSGVAIIELLNKLGGANGVGTIDIVENRLVGMKSRGVYETPGGTILMNAHFALETLILDRDTQFWKKQLANTYAQLVYDGQWFTPLREALDAFVDSTSKDVTGVVRMKLYKGNAAATALKSDHSLFNEAFATFGADEVYNQKDAEGFINLFSLPMKIRAIRDAEGGK